MSRLSVAIAVASTVVVLGAGLYVLGGLESDPQEATDNTDADQTSQTTDPGTDPVDPIDPKDPKKPDKNGDGDDGDDGDDDAPGDGSGSDDGNGTVDPEPHHEEPVVNETTPLGDVSLFLGATGSDCADADLLVGLEVEVSDVQQCSTDLLNDDGNYAADFLFTTPAPINDHLDATLEGKLYFQVTELPAVNWNLKVYVGYVCDEEFQLSPAWSNPTEDSMTIEQEGDWHVAEWDTLLDDRYDLADDCVLGMKYRVNQAADVTFRFQESAPSTLLLTAPAQ